MQPGEALMRYPSDCRIYPSLLLYKQYHAYQPANHIALLQEHIILLHLLDGFSNPGGNGFLLKACMTKIKV